MGVHKKTNSSYPFDRLVFYMVIVVVIVLIFIIIIIKVVQINRYND